MLEVPGQLVGKSEVRALLSALAIHPTTARFEALWGFLATTRHKIRWVDFKECFDLSEDLSHSLIRMEEEQEEEEKEATNSVRRRVARQRPQRRKTRKGRGSASTPPEGEGESEDDLLRSFYDVTFSSGLKDPTFDKFSTWSPLGRRGYRAAPATMRPMSVLSDVRSESGSPFRHGRSVHFKTRDIACQAEEASEVSQSLPILGPQKIPTLTPFSNLRNGSNLKMQCIWRVERTRQPQKSSNEDPAAPGATASLLLGAGEFQTHFQRSLGIAKSLETILQNNPGVVFNMDEKGFKSTDPNKPLKVSSGHNAQEMQSFVQAMFPTGLAKQTG